MPMLILDTSTERGFVAFVEGLQLLYHAQLPFGMQNAQNVLAEIQRGLTSLKLSIENMDFVAVGVGPGSYTGIRIGATVAKTLAFASDIPLVGVCSLDAFVPEEDGDFAAIIDAKIGGVYLQTGSVVNGRIKGLSGPQVHLIHNAVALLRGIEKLVTPNAVQLRSRFEKEDPCLNWVWLERYPSPISMAMRAKEKIDSGDFSLDDHLDLLYLRKTQAEIEKEKERS